MQTRTLICSVAALLAGASATTPASEVAALRDFYGALGGDGWLDSHHWNSARDLAFTSMYSFHRAPLLSGGHARS